MALVVIPKSVKSFGLLTKLIKAGEVVAAPTETAYGLLADATNSRAVARVVKLKGREARKPIALVAADIGMVRRYFRMSSLELKLAKKFWPGPLTLLLKPKRKFPKSVVGIRGRIGVRVPRSAWLRRVVKMYGSPLTATSANRAGSTTPYSAAAVVRELKSHGLHYLVNGGTLPHCATSTVVLVQSQQLKILREGAVPSSKLERVVG